MDSQTPTSRGKGPARRRKRTRKGGGRLPDLLFHACPSGRAEQARKKGFLRAGKGQSVFLSSHEGRTWQVAHRLKRDPFVIVVDVRRALRDGVRFRRGRTGLYMAEKLPFSCLINLHKGFEEQHSAGGFLVRDGQRGLELCLVACKRRSGKSWEIAKGKMEEGESPAATAMRELQEEMGFQAKLSVVEPLGMVRYAFTTPQREVRLKAMHLFLLSAEPCPEDFFPAENEGIVEVAWFPVREARARVRHASLRPVLRELERRFAPEKPQ